MSWAKWEFLTFRVSWCAANNVRRHSAKFRINHENVRTPQPLCFRKYHKQWNASKPTSFKTGKNQFFAALSLLRGWTASIVTQVVLKTFNLSESWVFYLCWWINARVIALSHSICVRKVEQRDTIFYMLLREWVYFKISYKKRKLHHPKNRLFHVDSKSNDFIVHNS